LFSFSFCQNVVIDENAQLKEQMEVLKENEVWNDFFICSYASVVLRKNLVTSSSLFVCLYVGSEGTGRRKRNAEGESSDSGRIFDG